MADLDYHLLLCALLAERTAAHLENGLEALTAPDGVLLELRHARLLDGVLDFLPAAADSGDLGLLIKLRLVLGRWAVDNSLLDGDDVREGEVRRAHGNLLGLWVDI